MRSKGGWITHTFGVMEDDMIARSGMEVTVYFDNSTLLHFDTYTRSHKKDGWQILSHVVNVSHTVNYISLTHVHCCNKIVHFTRFMVTSHLFLQKHSHTSMTRP